MTNQRITRRPTAADVAAAAGVSRATVGFVLNETAGQSISSAVSERVRAEATRLGYRPHSHARALARGRSGFILLRLPDWPVEQALRSIIDEASVALDQEGYSLITESRRLNSTARPLWESLDPDVVMSVEPLSPAEERRLREAGITVVPAAAHYAEEVAAVAMQIEHLVSRGRVHLAYASTAVPGFASMNELRLGRAREACSDLGLTLRDDVISADTGTEVVARWLRLGVTGVACFNDETAARVIGAATRLGAAVPADLAIIGHDDIPLAELIVPSLTTVRFDASGLGRYLASRALAATTGRPDPTNDPPPMLAEVVQREST